MKPLRFGRAAEAEDREREALRHDEVATRIRVPLDIAIAPRHFATRIRTAFAMVLRHLRDNDY